MLKGKRIELVPLEPHHLDNTRRWANDRALQAGILRLLPVTKRDQERWYQDVVDNPGKVVFAVETLDGREHIGNCGFYDIEAPHRRAELWILIGDRSRHGKGLGAEALALMLEYAFGRLNLNRVWLRVATNNAPAVALYEKNGFRKEGVLRAHCFVENEYLDVAIMGLLRDEYDRQERSQ